MPITIRDHRGMLHTGTFRQHAELQLSDTRRTQSVAQIIARNRLGDLPDHPDAAGAARLRVLAAEAPGTVIQVGDQPEGFGVQVDWVGEEDQAVLAFLNTGSELGLAVGGVRDGDVFELQNAAMRASFAVGTRNNGVAGLITVVGVGANVAAGIFELPELVPFITAATEYAAEQFPESETREKRRDAFGEDDNGGRARQEGGVIVCCPSAQTIYTSGSEDHQDRWIQGNGERIPENFPDHINPRDSAFFVRRNAGPQRITGSGELLLSAWDNGFVDNFGYYRLRFILRRGAPRDTDTPVPRVRGHMPGVATRGEGRRQVN